MKILTVSERSTGAEIGLKPGDKIEAIDGSRVKDIIDYRFKISDENILLRVRKSGAVQEFEIEKDYDDDLGLEFEDFRIRKCANDCIFCFVDQNPPGMREAVYFRDGDFRLSFLHGHYITMTNMGWNELKIENQSKVFKNVADKNHAYFIHSYEFIPRDKKHISITTNYGKDVIAAVSLENIFGSQFHPEKSQNTGIKILTNFLNL